MSQESEGVPDADTEVSGERTRKSAVVSPGPAEPLHTPRRVRRGVTPSPDEDHLRHLYLVVDADPDRPGELPVFLDPKHTRRLRPPSEDCDAGLPWMSPLEEYHLAWLEAHADAYPGCVLVRSDLAPDALAGALADRTLGIDPDGREVFIRWYDPSVLGPLLEACTESERRWWFEPVAVYGMVTGGNIEWLTKPDLSRAEPAVHAPPFRLTEEHLAVFGAGDSGALEAEIRSFIEEEHPDTFTDLSDEAATRLIQDGIGRAQRYGLVEVADLAAFVALMIDVSLTFDEQPAIHAILRSGDIPPEEKLPRAIAECSDDAWNEAEERDDG